MICFSAWNTQFTQPMRWIPAQQSHTAATTRFTIYIYFPCGRDNRTRAHWISLSLFQPIAFIFIYIFKAITFHCQYFSSHKYISHLLFHFLSVSLSFSCMFFVLFRVQNKRKTNEWKNVRKKIEWNSKVFSGFMFAHHLFPCRSLRLNSFHTIFGDGVLAAHSRWKTRRWTWRKGRSMGRWDVACHVQSAIAIRFDRMCGASQKQKYESNSYT